jgi:phage baseplate assembly protein W
MGTDTGAPFLGSGWAFPVDVDANGAVRRASLEDAVRQSIWTVLATAQGERVMRPDFGAGLADLVFAPDTAATRGLVASRVREALLDFEPRIDVLDVAVAADPDRPTRLLIDVAYQVRATNSRFNLVYPFFLEQQA